MTIEEYTKLVNNIVSNPDTAVVDAKTLLDEITKDVTASDSLKAANADYEKRVRDLQDTNIKLFLSQTGAPAHSDNEEPEEITLEDFAHKMVSAEKEKI